MKKQQGVTLSGFLMWAILGIVVLLLGFKVGPAYVEYYNIQKQFRAIAEDPGMRSGERHLIEGAFARRAAVENITSVEPRDIEITKQGDGIVVSAQYTTRVPLFGNASACLDFYPTSAK
ncbi:MAG: DUF4845 domain-containing protein [Rhodospirillaceae bacterium]